MPPRPGRVSDVTAFRFATRRRPLRPPLDDILRLSELDDPARPIVTRKRSGSSARLVRSMPCQRAVSRMATIPGGFRWGVFPPPGPPGGSWRPCQPRVWRTRRLPLPPCSLTAAAYADDLVPASR